MMRVIYFIVVLILMVDCSCIAASTGDALMEHVPDVSVGVGRDALCTNGWEQRQDQSTIVGPKYQAVVVSAWCQRGPLGGELLPTVFVFVRKSRQADSLAALAFRYDTLDYRLRELPRLQWRSATSLKITIPLQTISGISRKVERVDNVTVSYAFPGSYAPGATP